MPLNLNIPAIDAVIESYLYKTFPAVCVVIRQHDTEVYAKAFGDLQPTEETPHVASVRDLFVRPTAQTPNRPTTLATRFDLASVSKLFTSTAFMTLVADGHAALDQPVHEILPEFDGARAIQPYPHPLKPGEVVAVVPATPATADAGRVTFRHMLSHSSGLPAWLPLYQTGSRERAYEKALNSAFAYPIGAHVVYSDIGLILVGLAVERITGQRLDAVVRERVAQPLGLDSITYNPTDQIAEASSLPNIAPTEICAWRKRRLIGEVHDENAGGMDGVAGHAGLFGTARDLAAFGQMYLRGGAPLLQPEIVAEMTRLQAGEGPVRHGIGFRVWSPDPLASCNPFSQQVYGHTGFTGTSLWIDPTHALIVVCLTNRVFYGRNNADDLAQFRLRLGQAVVSGLQ